MNEGDWNSWRNLVLRDLKSLTVKVDRLTLDMERLKVKSGIWGAGAACVPITLLLIIQWMKG